MRPPWRPARPVPSAGLLRLVVSTLLLQSGGVGAAGAQTATVRVEENVRAEPNGAVLGRVAPGTGLSVEGRRDQWLEVDLEGWVWIQSLQITERGGLDLVVSAGEGENLRAEPRGAILGHLEPGALLEEVERIPGWIQVRRRGWIWAPSMDMPQVADPGTEGGRAEDAEDAEVGGPDRTAVFDLEILTAPPEGFELLMTPDGETLARIPGDVESEVVDRQGGWARVRLEGWVWAPEEEDGEEGPDPAARVASPDSLQADPSVEGGPTLEQVRAEPERHRGRIVTWTLQFVSLERAERVRTDFFRDEPFLLTRSEDREGAFVYVAVPPAGLEGVADLTPLERVEVRGRIRTGASAFTGSPILDLLELRRVERRREGGRPRAGG